MSTSSIRTRTTAAAFSLCLVLWQTPALTQPESIRGDANEPTTANQTVTLKQEIATTASFLRDRRDEVREHAIERLRLIAQQDVGQYQADLARVFVLASKNQNYFVRVNAVQALGELGVKSKTVIGALIDAMDDKKPVVRLATTHAIAELGVKSNNITKSLSGALNDETPAVRGGAMRALGKIGDYSSPTIQTLLQALQDTSWITRAAAASALGNLGTKLQSAYSVHYALLQIAQNPDENIEVRKAAAAAIDNIGIEAESSLKPIEPARSEQSSQK